MIEEQFSRTSLLLGADVMQRLRDTRVIVFGVGGVGSWCAEALVRSGVGHLTMVDADTVAASNINRQVLATTATVGCVKVEVMRRRLLDIAPSADIRAVYSFYDDATAPDFALDDFDYVIDAIDSLRSKILLIRRAAASRATLFSSMGAARKTDPRRVDVAEFWKVHGCPLAACLRKAMRQGERPARKFMCVFSDELVPNAGQPSAADNVARVHCADGERDTGKVHANGALVTVTATFGLTLASLVLDDVTRKAGK